MIIAQPDRTLDADDPGDDTLQRYRYQATYAAMIAVTSLDETAEIDEVFCELHEDVLVRTKNGKYRAIQIKTREPHRDAFRASEDDVIKALKRFVQLDRQFPDCFVEFLLGTNHRFVDTESKHSLPYLIRLARTGAAKMPSLLASFVKKLQAVVRGTAKVAVVAADAVLRVLSRVNVKSHLPALGGMERDLAAAIAKAHPDFGAASYTTIADAAAELVRLALVASSRGDMDANFGYAYIEASGAGLDQERQQILSAKRLHRSLVEDTIRSFLLATPSLMPVGALDPDAHGGDFSVTERKLIAGGLSPTTLSLATDCRSSTLRQGLEWMAKHGDSRGRERYRHVATKVLSECSAAAEASTEAGSVDGRKMYTSLRDALQRKLSDPDFSGSSLEHLLGHAFILTGQCKVWWSPRFDVKTKK